MDFGLEMWLSETVSDFTCPQFRTSSDLSLTPILTEASFSALPKKLYGMCGGTAPAANHTSDLAVQLFSPKSRIGPSHRATRRIAILLVMNRIHDLPLTAMIALRTLKELADPAHGSSRVVFDEIGAGSLMIWRGVSSTGTRLSVVARSTGRLRGGRIITPDRGSFSSTGTGPWKRRK